MKIKIKGKNAKVTTGKESPIITYTQKEDQIKEIDFFDNWFYISVFIAIFCGIGIGMYSGSIPFGIISSIILFGIMIFLNPKRRFFRLGASLILYAVTYLTMSSLHVEVNINNNDYLNGFFHFHKEFSMVAFLSLLISGILIILIDVFISYIKNKDSKYGS